LKSITDPLRHSVDLVWHNYHDYVIHKFTIEMLGAESHLRYYIFTLI